MLNLKRLILFLGLAASVATAQVPQLLQFQGRVAADGAAFSGTGQFKFALVNGDGSSTYWNHEGSSAVRQEPDSVVALPVSNGLFNVLLGDPSIPNMAPLAPGVFAQSDVRVRLWFNDGTHGFSRLEPDVRLAAVAYAITAGSVPDASITLAKLAPEARTSLGSWPTGTVAMVASDTQASNLVQAGFTRLPTRIMPGDWESHYLETPFPLGNMAGSVTNLWAGDGLWVWRWDAGRGLGARYEPGRNRWTLANTNTGPAFDPMGSFVTAHGSDLLVVNASMEQLRGARFNVAANAWQPLASLNAPSFSSPARWLWAGNDLIVLSYGTSGFTGARYQTATDTWQPLPTNGQPDVMISSARLTALPDGLLVIGSGLNGWQAARYRANLNLWQPMSTNGLTLAWLDGVQDIFTGSAWLLFENRMDGLAGLKYLPATDTWQPISTNGAPRGEMNTRFLWTGTEVAMVNIGTTTPMEGVFSARYNPVTDQWRPMNPSGPIVQGFPQAQLFASPTEILLVRAADPSKWARYDLAADRWTPLNGPSLGYDALQAWNGTQLISITLNPAMDFEPMLHIYTRAAPLSLYQKP
jgi:hypothetical protein